MKNICVFIVLCFSLGCVANVFSEADSRIMVELPGPMKQHMLQNMRGHLVVIDQLLLLLADDKLDAASDLAEYELGMSSLGKHGASHIAPFYPMAMKKSGTNMHKAASQFSRIAQEGEVLSAYKALRNITAACNVCHLAFKVQ
ncbi:MAG: hypothetical protein QM479_09925 [Pseudomonadota bacterium]